MAQFQFSVYRIKAESDKFCTKQEIINLYNDLIIYPIKFGQIFDTLYTIEFSWLENLDEIPKTYLIGKWLKDNTHNYFASPKWDMVPDFDSWGNVNDYYEEIVGVNFKTEELPFKCLFIKAQSKYPVLLDYACCLVPLFSKTDIRFFYFFSHYDENDWDGKTLNTQISWKTFDTAVKPFDNFYTTFQNFIMKFENYIIKAANDRFKEDTSDSTNENIASTNE